MVWIVRILGALLLFFTLLPLVPTGKWFVRGWDFPRLQIAILLCIPLALAIALGWQNAWPVESVCWTAFLSAGLMWQLSHVIRFSPLWPKEVGTATADSHVTKLMISNLDFENEECQSVAEEIRTEDPDILLLIENNQRWHSGLSDLRESFAYHHDEPRDDGLGIALWSKHRIHKAETREVVSRRRPSIWATIELSDGQRCSFVGVHPTPPGLMEDTGDTRRDSRERDAELVLAAKQIAERPDEPWVVGGDFNDVAWSHTTRLFKRISGLSDPRIGRTFMGTFIANVPVLRVPMDHVFLSNGFSIRNLRRRRLTGSDHFSVIAEICLSPELPKSEQGVDPSTVGNDEVEAEKLIEEGKQEAAERNLL